MGLIFSLVLVLLLEVEEVAEDSRAREGLRDRVEREVVVGAGGERKEELVGEAGAV